MTSAQQGRFGGTLSSAFTATGSSSFAEFLAAHDPTLLPGAACAPPGLVTESAHGTTIVAATFPGGVVMAGDRRATMGNIIAQRDIEKVFPADESSCVGIAGTAGLAVEMVKLFQVELEHYEKIEGTIMSLEGKANRLAALLRNNLGLAMQGLAVVPLFAGYDEETGGGRIFSYDVTGGRYEEHATTASAPARCSPGAPSRSSGARTSRRTTPSALSSRACTTRPTTTPPPAAPTSRAASCRSSRWSTPTATDGWPSPSSTRSCGRSSPRGRPGPTARTRR